MRTPQHLFFGGLNSAARNRAPRAGEGRPGRRGDLAHRQQRGTTCGTHNNVRKTRAGAETRPTERRRGTEQWDIPVMTTL